MTATTDALQGAEPADFERRFGGLRRLFGATGYALVRSGSVAVVGLGGVGSWVVEALARSGVAALTLIDLDHVAESNINRQVQAVGSTVGMAKAEALRQRIADIHPGCSVTVIEEFVSEDNWPALLARPVDVVVDGCDQPRAKAAMAAWSLLSGVPLITVGAAGGKQMPQAVEVADLGAVTHDPLLASLRQRLRQRHGAPRAGSMGVRCVFSREAVLMPESACAAEGALQGDLNCHGYGSSVAVTATFGLVAANEALQALLRRDLHASTHPNTLAAGATL